MADQSAGGRDALPPAAGQIARSAFSERRQTDPIQQRFGMAPAFDRCRAPAAKPDIVADVQPRRQPWLLKYRANARMRARNDLIAEPDFSRRGFIQCGHQPRQGRLAGAGATRDGNDLAGAYGDLDAARGLGAGGGRSC